MNEFLTVLILSLLPAFGITVGGLLADRFAVSEKTLSLALHGAAGVVLGIVAVELLPEALRAETPWIIILAFFLGGVFFVLMDQALGLIRERFGAGSAGEAGGSAWLIFFGVAVDLFSDGVMIGTGSTLSFSLALLLALGQLPADIPEGFATIAAFKRRGIPRAKRLLLTAGFTLPILLGATIGYWAVRGQPDIYKFALLAFTAGVLTTVVVEEIVPEAHADGEARLAALVFVGGFSLFALLSTYVA